MISRHGNRGELPRRRLPIAFAGSPQVLARERLGNDDDGPLLEDVVPGDRAPCDQPVAHRLEIPGPDALEPPELDHRPFRVGEFLNRGVVAVVFAVHRDGRRETNGGDAGHARQLFGYALERAHRLLWIADQACRYRENERLHLLGAREPWVDLTHRDKRSNHQPRHDQQRERQGDLSHDQRIARAVAAGSVAGRSTSLLERRDARLPESDDGKGAAQRTAQHRDGHCEQQHHPIDADVVDTRQLRGRDRAQQPNRRLREQHAEQAARERQHHALRQQRAGDPAAAGAEGGTHGELLMAPFRAHQEQVRDVAAGDRAARRRRLPAESRESARRCGSHRPRAGARSAATPIARTRAAGARSCARRRRSPGRA